LTVNGLGPAERGGGYSAAASFSHNMGEGGSFRPPLCLCPFPERRPHGYHDPEGWRRSHSPALRLWRRQSSRHDREARPWNTTGAPETAACPCRRHRLRRSACAA
jgi:hypothetical protein